VSINKYLIGRAGENMAREYLEAMGWKTVELNFQNRWGEIDLIMLEGEIVVFVEVKYKRDEGKGKPEEMINLHKIKQVRLMAQLFLEKEEYRQYRNFKKRIDAVCITGSIIKHYRQIDE